MTNVAGERCWLYPKNCHPLCLIIKIFLYWSHLSVSIHMGPKYLHISYPFWDLYTGISSPHFIATNFPIVLFFFLNLWACIQTIGHSIWIDIHLCFWTLPFLRKINNQVHGLSSAYGRVYLHYTPSGMSQKRVIMLQLTTLGGACTCRTICKPSLSFLFLSELVVENSSWRHRCGIWERG